ncbi:IclR family transcriptional regulator domain-containing protein, partial [Streptomyces sp. Agncl-13]|uniref:IclR family transcriptional regulator domain-containing protein n=1 Tax=Streptomyces sp. Agncl-13 TaxID=3400628 RepID=UPI003A8BFC7F
LCAALGGEVRVPTGGRCSGGRVQPAQQDVEMGVPADEHGGRGRESVQRRRHTPRTLVLPGQLARDLARTRARGYGVNLEEAEIGISAVAAPVYAQGSGPRPIAAISVTGGTRGLDVDRIGARLCAAARAITRSLSV